jgi:murein DD-endopeptidase MepM/ murein hydrolase activator NlpD
MARMRMEDKSKYPRLAAFLPEALHRCYQDERKMSALLKFSQLTRDAAEKALTRFDTNPWISISDIGLGPFGTPALGMFDIDFKNTVFLAEDVARQFEEDFSMAEAQELIEATILHEIVHWGDFFDDSLQSGDPGAMFEMDVYGKRHTRWFERQLESSVISNAARFIFPMAGRIGGGTAYWGENIRSGGTRSHHGIDIYNGIGTPVHAVADGTVLGGNRYRKGSERKAEINNYGQMVDIDHGNGFVSRYAHLDTVEINPGPIKQAQRIGSMGATGTQWGRWLFENKPTPAPPEGATAPHLHFEIRRASGKPFKSFKDTLDPASFFEFIGNGRAARNTPVTALQPGIKLDSPVPETATSPDNQIEALGANMLADITAYPNTNYAPSDPRGLRNNNPGNIKRDQTDWVGLRPSIHQLDPVFFQFTAMRFGIRAMARILKNYSLKQGINSLRGMSERWAPADDGNDPLLHARIILSHCRGVCQSVDETISLSKPDIQFGIIRGIMVAENGPKAETVSDETVLKGIDLECVA